MAVPEYRCTARCKCHHGALIFALEVVSPSAIGCRPLEVHIETLVVGTICFSVDFTSWTANLPCTDPRISRYLIHLIKQCDIVSHAVGTEADSCNMTGLTTNDTRFSSWFLQRPTAQQRPNPPANMCTAIQYSELPTPTL